MSRDSIKLPSGRAVFSLAGAIVVLSCFALASYAQVGPLPPPEKPKAEPVGEKLKSFKKFFSEKDAAQTEGGQPSGPGNKNFDGEKTTTKNTAVPFKPDPRRPETWGDDPKKTNRPASGPAEQPQQQAEVKRAPLLNQPPLTGAKIEDPQIDPNRPPKQTLRLDDANNPLGYADAVNQIRKIDALIKEKRLSEARGILIPLRQWLIDCTEAHINLFNTLNKLPSARTQAELEKQLALEFAMLRDRAIFELGMLYVEEKEYKKAVKELIEVIKSQPKSKAGILSYEMLQEIGFTEKIQLDVTGAKTAKPNSTAKDEEGAKE